MKIRYSYINKHFGFDRDEIDLIFKELKNSLDSLVIFLGDPVDGENKFPLTIHTSESSTMQITYPDFALYLYKQLFGEKYELQDYLIELEPVLMKYEPAKSESYKIRFTQKEKEILDKQKLESWINAVKGGEL